MFGLRDLSKCKLYQTPSKTRTAFLTYVVVAPVRNDIYKEIEIYKGGDNSVSVSCLCVVTGKTCWFGERN